ncbi:MAG TPA: NUDIX domain-containing protein [Candidatus Limnocylindria bacterium]
MDAAGRWTRFWRVAARGAIRELEEETGLTGEITELAEVLSWSGRWTHPRDGVDEAYHGLQIVYRVRVTGGVLRDEVGGSTDHAEWFTRDQAEAAALVELAHEALRLAFGA